MRSLSQNQALFTRCAISQSDTQGRDSDFIPVLQDMLGGNPQSQDVVIQDASHFIPFREQRNYFLLAKNDKSSH